MPQQLNPTQCDLDVYKDGVTLGVFDMTREDADRYCLDAANKNPGFQFDWHYSGGRVVIKALAPHQQRVVAERDELNEKLIKLQAFTLSAVFMGLPDDERSRLHRQERAMLEYSAVLSERIAAFPSPTTSASKS